MRNIFSFLLLLIGISLNAQYAPTGTRTQFKNALALGSRDTSAFTAADSLVVTIDRNGQMWYRSPLAWRKVTHSSGSDFVPYTGAVASVNLGNNGLTAKRITSDSLIPRTGTGMDLYAHNGQLVARYGNDGGAQWTNYGFAGYDANRSASYTARSFTDKNYVDSSAALRIRYTDTAAMLSPFVQYSDTASMLSPYRRTSTKITNIDLVNSTISGVALGIT